MGVYGTWGNYNYGCCYNDANSAIYVPNDLTKRFVGPTTLFNLRNLESPINSWMIHLFSFSPNIR
jgi:hypothetical protein